MTPSPPRAVHLDASFLIRALVTASAEANTLDAWVLQRRQLEMSALAWGEFLCGPLTAEDEAVARHAVRTLRSLGVDDASRGATLFNATGRRRGSFPDCLIAAVAIEADASLATSNLADFDRFRSSGLVIEEV